MVTLDRIRLTGLLRKKPWKRGFFYCFPDQVVERPLRMDDLTGMKCSRVTLGIVAFLFVVAGCGYDDGADLAPVVERATPADARILSACGGSGGLIESPSRSCTFLAPGDGGAVTTALANALREDGFEVACRRPGEVTAVRDDIRFLAEVTQHGSVDAPGGDKPIPAGSVAVKIDASRLVEASAAFWRGLAREGGSCAAPVPKPNLAQFCVNWWNVSGIDTASDAVRRGARPPAEVRPAWGNQPKACTYTLRARGRFLRVTARSEPGGGFIWPRLRALSRPGAFRPNALLSEDGRLDLT